ncbi:hypothetical protein NA57DRAFT_54096 [Rhizodiscina lignyota]|uniref:Uncharacterized protein n=1 Tax=Rhizodiscina lignyota TaxID=1504668 RepID=A0A9P4ILX8_9PEZI|nr:hypothetical protein NA57DRAFT_54096 [Rhizodiscina lignyota]
MASSITTFNGQRCTKVRRAGTAVTATTELTTTSIVSTTVSSSGMAQAQAASASSSSSSSSSSTSSSSSSSSSTTSTSTSSLPSSSSSTSSSKSSSTIISSQTSSHLASSTPPPFPITTTVTPPPSPPPTHPGSAAASQQPSIQDPALTPAAASPSTQSSTQPSTSVVSQPPPSSSTPPASASPTPTPSSQTPVPAILPSPSSQSSISSVDSATPSSSSSQPVRSSNVPSAVPASSPQPFTALPDSEPTALPDSEPTALPDTAPTSSVSTEVSPIIPVPTESSSALPTSSSAPLPGSSPPPTAQPIIDPSISSSISTVSTSPTAAAVAPASVLSPPSAGVSPSETHDPSNHDSSADHQSSGSGSNTVAIAVGSVSGVVALLVISALLFFCIKRRIFRNRFVEVHTPPPPQYEEKRAFGSGNVFKPSAWKESISRPFSFFAALKGQFRGRSGSRVGLTEDADPEPAPTTIPEIQAYRSRRSQSEPRQSMAWLNENNSRISIVRPIAVADANVGRPRSIDSPGQINHYQIPYDPNSGNVTPIQKTLRVVNSDDFTPNLAAPMATADDSYFTVQKPAKTAAPILSSHRRSVSLQPQTQNPFMDTPEESMSSNQFDFEWLRKDPMRGVSQAEASIAPSSLYSVPRRSLHSSHREQDDLEGFQRASVELANAIAISRNNSRSYTTNPFSDPELFLPPPRPSLDKGSSRVLEQPSRASASNRSSVSSITSSIVIKAQTIAYDSSINNSSVTLSPITQASLGMSRNTSDASNGYKRTTYDPFNYNPASQSKSQVATASKPGNMGIGIARSTSTASAVSRRSAEGTFFDDAASLELGEPGPTRPGTQAYPGFTMLNGPMASSRSPMPDTRRTTRVSNDPFDLDRPELLGYSLSVFKKKGMGNSPSLQRSDSTASKRSTFGGKRRSSVQLEGWKYLDRVDELSAGSAAGLTR